MTRVVRRSLILAAGTCLALAALLNPALAAASDDGIFNIILGNGIQARVYSAEYLSSVTEAESPSRGHIVLEDGRYLSVVTDIDDPLITNKGDGSFHPFETEDVVAALSGIAYRPVEVHVEVFLLPYPRTNLLVSSASGTTMYLSPQVREISTEGAAYVVAHEFGHAFQSLYMPERARRHWDEYRHLRGIEDRDRYADDGRHADRPSEIFAEDFRVLFGGEKAYFGGHVENTALLPPEHVPGLREFFSKLSVSDFTRPFIVGVGNSPNPFNPMTELSVELADNFVATGERVTVNVYNVRGARVRELYSGFPSTTSLRVQWDGRDGNGREVASSTYFAVVTAGQQKVTHKLLMIK